MVANATAGFYAVNGAQAAVAALWRPSIDPRDVLYGVCVVKATRLSSAYAALEAG